MTKKEIEKLVKACYNDITFIPTSGKSKSPCNKCLGLISCSIKKRRNPDKECGAFFEDSQDVHHKKERT
jgi:hypothetical protein